MPRPGRRVDRALVLRLWDEGWTKPKIAAAARCHRNHVLRIVKEAGRPNRALEEKRRIAAIVPMIVDFYRSGVPIKVIAYKVGCSRSHISNVIAALGIERRSPNHPQAGGNAARLYTNNGEMIARLYAECSLPLDEIARLYGCSKTTLKKYARLAGIPRRTAETWKDVRRAEAA